MLRPSPPGRLRSALLVASGLLALLTMEMASPPPREATALAVLSQSTRRLLQYHPQRDDGYSHGGHSHVVPSHGGASPSTVSAPASPCHAARAQTRPAPPPEVVSLRLSRRRRLCRRRAA